MPITSIFVRSKVKHSAVSAGMVVDGDKGDGNPGDRGDDNPGDRGDVGDDIVVCNCQPDQIVQDLVKKMRHDIHTATQLTGY